MTYNTYVLLLCGIVYATLTLVSIAVIVTLTKMSLRLVRHGAEDENILKEYAKMRKKRKKSRGRKILSLIPSVLLFLVFSGAFGFSLYVNLNEDSYFEDVPTMRIVQSESMSKKLETNKYLFENGLNDQFETFDMIFTYKVPDQFELELYDIIVYETDGVLIIHRIVEIEEPNAVHPNERYFRLQGDAVDTPDRFPVKYSQMKAIYRGEKVPFIGSFIMFLQSPAGWMCMILMLAAMLSTPLVDKKLARARENRWQELLARKREEMAKQNSTAAPVCLYPVYYDPQDGVPFLDTTVSKDKLHYHKGVKK